MRTRRRRTNITLWDYLRLKHLLLSQPRRVLREFACCQIESLEELPVFQAIREEDPEAAYRIEIEARRMGIALRGDGVIE
jgi:hypothetical protein